MFSVPLYLVPILVVVCLYKVASQALPRYFLTPTQNWKEKIQKVIDHPKPIYLPVGSKRSAFRRRLVTASAQPSYYTNYVNNRLKLLPADAANGDAFMAKMKIRDPNDPRRKLIYGFFHPYANNGGGGEKVLWQAVSATLLQSERNVVAIYTTSTDAEPLQILAKAEAKFQIAHLDSARIVFVYLRRAGRFIDSAYWRHFTLVGQLLGSFLLGLEAMNELSPDVWIDTMGLPGSYFAVSVVLKIPVVAYVHYPIIQPDMFNRLKFRAVADLARFRFSAGDARDAAKFAYWSALYFLYACLGSCVDLAYVNGTWTHNHMRKIWFFNRNKPVEILYPPCATEHLQAGADARENKLLYIAQFRPEKRHSLVLAEYCAFLARFRAAKTPVAELPRLVFLGSCRTKDDSQTLEALRAQADELGLNDHLEFVVDCSFDEVKRRLHTSKFGLNAMWNEHFGIGVVEYLAAGVVPLVHASAGPLLDIMAVDGPSTEWRNDVGYFFKSEQDPDFEGLDGDKLRFTVDGKECLYPKLSDALGALFIEEPELASEANLQKQRDAGGELVRERFSTQRFTEVWMNAMEKIALLEAYYREHKRDKVDKVY